MTATFIAEVAPLYCCYAGKTLGSVQINYSGAGLSVFRTAVIPEGGNRGSICSETHIIKLGFPITNFGNDVVRGELFCGEENIFATTPLRLGAITNFGDDGSGLYCLKQGQA